jgi:hypothetical protein
MTIEITLHETTDPRMTADPKGEIFEALGLYRDVEFAQIDAFYEVRCPLIGAPLVTPHGVDGLRKCLAARFPAQVDSIKRFLKHVESIQSVLRIFSEKHDGLWWLAYAVAQGGFFHGGGNYLKEGSQVLSDRLVVRIHEGGGEVLAGRKAIEVLLNEQDGV